MAKDNEYRRILCHTLPKSLLVYPFSESLGQNVPLSCSTSLKGSLIVVTAEGRLPAGMCTSSLSSLSGITPLPLPVLYPIFVFFVEPRVDRNVCGKCWMMNARRVGNDAQTIPKFTSMTDHVAVPGLSHDISVVVSSLCKVFRRKIEAILALSCSQPCVHALFSQTLTNHPGQE
jgi:hypothetical protein